MGVISTDASMIYSTITTIIVWFLWALTALADVTENWQKPFQETIDSFKLGIWHEHPMTEGQLIEDSKHIYRFLKKNRKEWAPLLDPKIKPEELVTPRRNLKERIRRRNNKARLFFKKQYSELLDVIDIKDKDEVPLTSPRIVSARLPEHQQSNWPNSPRKNERQLERFGHLHDAISRVFDTKSGTLVMQMNYYPDIIVKIDDRPGEKILRNYSAAFVAAQNVQRANRFRFLFFPYEFRLDGKKRHGHGTVKSSAQNQDHEELPAFNVEQVDPKFVFSERVPLFSDAAIDNMVLIHLMLDAAREAADIHSNYRLLKRLKYMYIEMIQYICQVNFGDINFSNVPWTKDGRLAPFDTDSLFADSGVPEFLRLFYADRIFSSYETEIRPFVDAFCPQQPTSNPFKNQASLDEQAKKFELNKRVYESMLQFFRTRPPKPTEDMKLSQFFVPKTSSSLPHFPGELHLKLNAPSQSSPSLPIVAITNGKAEETIDLWLEANDMEETRKRISVLDTIEKQLSHDPKMILYAIIVDQMIARKLTEPSNRKLFGRRCDDAREFATRAAIELQEYYGGMDIDYADAAVAKILQMGLDKGIIFGFEGRNIQKLMAVKFDYWTGFICF